MMTEIVTVFVEFIPETIKSGILYISREYNSASHLCACGCGTLTVTPLNHGEGELKNMGWDFTENNGTVTLSPSIENKPCGAHYHIQNNKIIPA